MKRKLILFFIFIISLLIYREKWKNKLELEKQGVERFKSSFELIERWMQLRGKGISTTSYFKSKDYRHIAIYGMGKIGKNLYDELENSEIFVDYGIDEKIGIQYKSLEIRHMYNALPKVDAIIVTPIYDYDSIKENLEAVVEYPVISLKEIIYGGL